MRLPNTLFARTSLTISSALLIFMSFTGLVIFNYILVPVGKQGAADLAALMVLSAKTWVELPPTTREDFQRELFANHDLRLEATSPAADMAPIALHPPYLLFLEEALGLQLGHPVHIHQTADTPDWHWAIIPIADKTLYMGVRHGRVGAKPPRAALIILLGASLFILLTTLLVVRRITRPLEVLSQGVKRLGSGAHHQPLPENAPKELSDLASKFNLLSNEIQQLLDNRTTLLGGISHDLRTPLSRLRIAVELLQSKEDAELLHNMRRDMEEMDALITRTLELAKMMQEDEVPNKAIDLGGFLQAIGTGYSQEGKRLETALETSCAAAVNELILQRILHNLLDNAFHYAGEGKVVLRLQCKNKQAQICILDQGTGIPEDQIQKVLQPFYRIDHSRNRSTGGSGLGLAIVQQLAQLQGWKITLANRSSGGLSACIEIPENHASGAGAS
ncbi:MAG TPA: HAMP domain-containing protein [Chromatiaceae bacterium]|nr:HAMP domain-containing protein [Chromatiaceae bacterium]